MSKKARTKANKLTSARYRQPPILRRGKNQRWAAIIVLALSLWLVGTSVYGQERRPDLGFQHLNSYSISDIENVNLSNGNLMLRIPLASLPAGRGTTPGYTVALNYNSKLWNAKQVRTLGGIGENPEDQFYMRELVDWSDQGGWYLDRGDYRLNLVNRLTLETEAPCMEYSGAEAYRNNAYQFKLEMQLPDGIVKQFLPFGYDYDGAGYSRLDPYGVEHSYSYSPPTPPVDHPNCISDSLSQPTTAGINYYTNDGSNLRLLLPYQPGTGVPLMRWTLYFPDGRVLEKKPVGDTSIDQRLTDRNGNKVLWKGATLNGEDGIKIENEVGQFVFIGNNKVIQKGVNGDPLETTWQWKDVWVYQHYRATNAPNANTTLLFADLFQSLSMIDKITLPTQAGGLEFSFAYNGAATSPAPGNYTDGWGELKSITLPSTAKADYSYSLDGSTAELQAFDVLGNSVGGRVLIYHTQYDGSTQEVTEATGYGSGPGGGGVCTSDGRCQGQAAAIGGDQAGLPYRIARTGGSVVEKIWFGRSSVYNWVAPFAKTEFTSVPDASGNPSLTATKGFEYDQNGNVLEIREYDWVPYSSVPRSSTGAVDEILPVPRPTGTPSGLVLKRKTVNTYYNPTPNATTLNGFGSNFFGNPSSPRLHSVLKSTEVQDGSGTIKARSEFFYDDPSNKGNLIETRVWDSNKGGLASPDSNGSRLNTGNSISTTTVYDQYGNPTLLTDAKGVQTAITYGSILGPAGYVTGLYPTQTEIASNYLTQKQTSTAAYDFYTGVVTTATDADNNVSVVTEYDALGRIKKVRAAANTALESWTTTEYDDINRRVTVRSDVETIGDQKNVATQFYDQLGRVRLSKTVEDAATQSAINETDGIKVETRYQTGNPNSYQLTSNPFRAAYATQATNEQSMGWTRSTSINTGHHSEVEAFAGAALPAPWGSNATSTGMVKTDIDATTIENNQPGVVATVTDQSGKHRRSITNALGQLSRVDEPIDDPSGNPNLSNLLGDVATPNQPTIYTYDELNNLRTVLQAGNTTQQCGGASSCTQTRTFTYSSLSRLVSAANPESGMITYTYDDNGNLVVKTDARNVSAHYSYDELNRAIRRWYNGSGSLTATTNNNPALPSSVGTSDEVTYNYDSGTITYGKGRLASVSSSVSTFSYSGYDALGRAGGATHTIGSQTYSLTYNYDLAGRVKSMSYPSGHVVNYNYDAAGRLNTFGGNLGDGLTRTYTTGVIYDAGSRMTKEQFGTDTPIFNKLFYNSRGQLAEIRASTTYTDPADTNWDLGAIINHYSNQSGCWGASCNATDNNGNLMRQEVFVPITVVNHQVTSSISWWQGYEYDSLNRITQANEYSNQSAPLWKQWYTYDRFGNRKIDVNNTSASIPHTDFEVDTGTNRLLAPGDLALTGGSISQRKMRYDDAGNLVNDSWTSHGSTTPVATRTYDAENRMTSAPDSAGGTTHYYYDGDGRRVRRVITNQPEVWQVYGLGGELLAEYAANAVASSPQKEYGYRNGQLLITAEPATAAAPPPSALVAVPSGTVPAPTITLNWSAASGATNYRVERKGATGDYTLAVTTASTSFIDNGVSAANAYLYKVCAANGSGACTSSYTNIALGTAMNFTDAAIISIVDDPTGVTVTTLKLEHITELRAAVNAVRHLAGLPDAIWTNPTLNRYVSLISKDDVQDLRTRLNEALTALGIQTSAYDDSTLVGAPNGSLIRKIHLTELRARATSGLGGSGGTGGATTNIEWLVTDQLGTPRMIFDKTGSLANTKRHDYLPFGEELAAGQGLRNNTLGYGTSDPVRQKFTQKERDTETRLDYSINRYYSPIQGRFTSVDPESVGARVDDPQSWNGYSYALNNPLRYIDPNGLAVICRQGGQIVSCAYLYDRISKGEFETVTFTSTTGVSVTVRKWDFIKPGESFERADGTLVTTTNFDQTAFLAAAGRIVRLLQANADNHELDAASTQSGEGDYGGGGKGGSWDCHCPGFADDPYHPDNVRYRQQTNEPPNGPSALEEARRLGFNRRIPPQRAPFDSHGEEVFTDGRRFITRDNTGHKGGVWKMFDRQGRRVGTYDANLEWIDP